MAEVADIEILEKASTAPAARPTTVATRLSFMLTQYLHSFNLMLFPTIGTVARPMIDDLCDRLLDLVPVWSRSMNEISVQKYHH